MYHNSTELQTAELPPETPEQAYRRGYRDGVLVAVSDISDILGRLGRCQSRKIEHYFRWAEEVLQTWERRAEVDDSVEFPPVYRK